MKIELDQETKDWINTKMQEIVHLVLPDQPNDKPIKLVEEPRAAISLAAVGMALVTVMLFASRNREEFEQRQKMACDAIMAEGAKMADVAERCAREAAE